MKFIQQLQAEIDNAPPSPPPAGLEALDIRQVAGLLRCTVDTARRIPRRELPAYRVGKRLVFRRSEVLGYLWSQKLSVNEFVAEDEPPASANDEAPRDLTSARPDPGFNSRLKRIRDRRA